MMVFSVIPKSDTLECYVCKSENNLCLKPEDFKPKEADTMQCTGACVAYELFTESQNDIRRYCNETYDKDWFSYVNIH